MDRVLTILMQRKKPDQSVERSGIRAYAGDGAARARLRDGDEHVARCSASPTRNYGGGSTIGRRGGGAAAAIADPAERDGGEGWATGRGEWWRRS